MKVASSAIGKTQQVFKPDTLPGILCRHAGADGLYNRWIE